MKDKQEESKEKLKRHRDNWKRKALELQRLLENVIGILGYNCSTTIKTTREEMDRIMKIGE